MKKRERGAVRFISKTIMESFIFAYCEKYTGRKKTLDRKFGGEIYLNFYLNFNLNIDSQMKL